MVPWNHKKAYWYARAVAASNYGQVVAQAMAPFLAGCRTLLDIGAGVGALAVPLAESLAEITALEPSLAMRMMLQQGAEAQRVKNIKIVPGSWGEVKIEPHDAVLCANVPGLWQQPEKFLEELQSVARYKIFLILRAGPEQDKFYFKELYPLILGRPFPPKEDYLPVYNLLRSQGRDAHVKILDYNLDQPFDTLEEAVDFWKQHMNLKGDTYNEPLEKFLQKKLIKTSPGYLAFLPKKSAFIWWSK